MSRAAEDFSEEGCTNASANVIYQLERIYHDQRVWCSSLVPNLAHMKKSPLPNLQFSWSIGRGI
jgi:hypothetical protein